MWIRLVPVFVMALLVCGCGSAKRQDATGQASKPLKYVDESTGTGEQTLDPVRYPKGADVVWTCSNCSRLVITIGGRQLVASTRKSGTANIPAGTFPIKVSSDGAWDVKVYPK